MSQGIYIATSGSLLQERKLEVLANNLANASTPGYKEDKIAFKSYLMTSEMPVQPVQDLDNNLSTQDPGGAYAAMLTIETNFSQGDLQFTDNPLNLAMMGPGFFVVNTPQGERYTRQGTFSIDAKGQLVTSGGYPLKGKGLSDIRSGKLEIDTQGNLFLNGVPKGTLELVEFMNPQSALQKQGNNLYALQPQHDFPQKADKTIVKQGFLELANINSVKEMVNLIQVTRLYESFQKVIWSINESTGKAINEVGRLG